MSLIPEPGRFHTPCDSLGPMHHSYSASSLEPVSTTTEAHVIKACAMQQEKPLQLEAQAPSSPTAGESPCVATQHSQK